MKLVRLSVLLLALIVSVLTAPEAFGAKGTKAGGVKKVGSSDSQRLAASGCEGYDYEISCNNGSGACCSGGLFDCWDACEWYCGGPCVYQI
jgi:hypothetical protein